MGTANLITGETMVTKNNAVLGTYISTIAFDEDLGIFKVIHQAGNIWITFRPSQVTSLTRSVTGALFKSYWLHINVKFPTGDEFKFSYKVNNTEQIEGAIKWVDYAARKDKAISEVHTLLTTREKVQLSEVASILTTNGLPSDQSNARRLIETEIATKQVEGVLSEDQFVSKYALNREQVRYEIVSKFEMTKEGVVVLKCPNCGASLPLTGKESQGSCRYCGTSYTVPRNILNLL